MSLIFKASFDAGFLYILHHIYNGFDLPRMSKCSLEPCPNTVDCFISRPTEKKIFTLFMVVSSVVCIIMCICEMIYFICKRILKHKRKTNQMMRKAFADNHEMRQLAAPRSELRSKSSIRIDPTTSIQNLNNMPAEEREKEARNETPRENGKVENI